MSTTDISRLSDKLYLNSEGIWQSSETSEVSYPEDGNQSCFELEDDSFWFEHRNEVFELLFNTFSPKRTFFDIGGGNGCVSMALQNSGTEVLLLEPGPSGALNARNRGVKTVVQSTLEDAGIAPASLPAAGAFDVLEHIEDDEAFLASIASYLMPDGIFYISVPAYSWLWSYEDIHAGHFRRYTQTSLNSALSANGFEVLYSSYLFAFLVLPIALMRSLPTKLRLRNAVSQETTAGEHSAPGGIVGDLLSRSLSWEAERVRKSQTVPFGSSVVAVARKKPE